MLPAICKVADVPEDGVLRVERDGLPALAIYKWEGEFYCTDDLCTHGAASLADGEIEDGMIICPFHLGAFCIKTGTPTAAPCAVPIRSYAVTVAAGEIFIED